MLKVIFYPKADKAKANGECPIFAKVSYEMQSFTIATGKFIEIQRWKQTNKLRNILKIEKEKVIRYGLELLRLDIERKFNTLFGNESEFDFVLFKNQLTKVQNTKIVNVKQVFTLHNDYFKKKVNAGERAIASYQKYQRAKDLLQQFIKTYYGCEDYDPTKIDSAFIMNLETFLRYESVYKGQIGIKNNSVIKYFKMFKTTFNYAIRLELIAKNPFNHFKGKLVISDTVFLTTQELERIERKEFDISRLNKVKDIFLFSCYTGYAPVDAMKLNSSNLLCDGNGDLWIKANRTKTHIKANVPVLPSARKIIAKYELTGKVLPEISNQKMNAYLKEIADLCSIQKNLTWYVARHTFATTVTLGNGIKMENVSAMMGHTNLKQTQHYAKILDHNVMSDMKKLF